MASPMSSLPLKAEWNSLILEELSQRSQETQSHLTMNSIIMGITNPNINQCPSLISFQLQLKPPVRPYAQLRIVFELFPQDWSASLRVLNCWLLCSVFSLFVLLIRVQLMVPIQIPNHKSHSVSNSAFLHTIYQLDAQFRYTTPGSSSLRNDYRSTLVLLQFNLPEVCNCKLLFYSTQPSIFKSWHYSLLERKKLDPPG